MRLLWLLSQVIVGLLSRLFEDILNDEKALSYAWYINQIQNMWNMPENEEHRENKPYYFRIPYKYNPILRDIKHMPQARKVLKNVLTATWVVDNFPYGISSQNERCTIKRWSINQ